MAEGTSVRPADVVCRYFFSSSCRDGDRCLFSHDSARRIPDNVCRYYLQGICVFGEHCRYDHVRVNKEGNSKSHSQTDRHAAESSRRSENSGRNSFQPRFNSLSNNTFRNEVSNANSPGCTSTNWINAPEFVPKTTRSYADTVKANTGINSQTENLSSMELCLNHAFEQCPFEGKCPYVHGELCQFCGKSCLHPYNEEQRKVHMEECEKVLLNNMELSFAVQRSMNKICGICMDVVVEKEPLSERRFGILEKCNHVYCMSCIRTWRRSKQYDSNQHIDNALYPVTRTCPECRITSDFIIPSMYYVNTEEDKKKLIMEYKKALSQKPCKYFKQGEGTCPFGGACFYLHAKPDGTKVELAPPNLRRRQNQYGDLESMNQVVLWDYLESRDESAWRSLEELRYA